MNLQSYFATADLASLHEDELAGLVPFLIGRPLDNEVVVIATSHDRPDTLRTIPLADLDNEVAYGIAAAFWTHTSADKVWLVGHGNDVEDTAAAIGGLAAALEPQGFSHKKRQIVLDPTCRNWRYAFEDDELAFDDDELDWGPIRRTDPLMGRLAALVFHAACVATREAEAFAPRPGRRHRNSTFAMQELITSLRDRIRSGNEVTEEDQHLLENTIDAAREGQTADVTLIDLGVVLAASPGLVQRAIAVIWESEPDPAFNVWAGIARCTHGRARAIGCALAALAAWRLEDPLATIASREALVADADCVFAQSVATIIASGALWSNFDGSDHLGYLAASVSALDEIEGVA